MGWAAWSLCPLRGLISWLRIISNSQWVRSKEGCRARSGHFRGSHAIGLVLVQVTKLSSQTCGAIAAELGVEPKLKRRGVDSVTERKKGNISSRRFCLFSRDAVTNYVPSPNRKLFSRSFWRWDAQMRGVSCVGPFWKLWKRICSDLLPTFWELWAAFQCVVACRSWLTSALSSRTTLLSASLTKPLLLPLTQILPLNSGTSPSRRLHACVY